MNRLTIARFVIAEMLAVEVQRLEAEGRSKDGEILALRTALRASEESHENLARRFWEEVTA